MGREFLTLKVDSSVVRSRGEKKKKTLNKMCNFFSRVSNRVNKNSKSECYVSAVGIKWKLIHEYVISFVKYPKLTAWFLFVLLSFT